MSHIFISYSKKDRDYARRLANHLLAQGFDVWIDDRIDYGEMWERVIFQAIDACAAFVVIMSPSSYDSDWVLRECNYADRRKKPQFPLLLSGEEFPRYSAHQFVDVRDRSMPNSDFTRKLANYVPLRPTGKVITQEVRALPPSGEPLGRGAPPISRRRRQLVWMLTGMAAVFMLGLAALVGLALRFIPPAAAAPTPAPSAFITPDEPTAGFTLAPSPFITLNEPAPTDPPLAVEDTPTPRPACENNLPLRLAVGDTAVVTAAGVGVRLRGAPSLTADILDTLDAGTTMHVIGGPSCDAVNRINWWQVRVDDQEGWLVEGALPDEYYVEPITGE